MVEPFLLVLVNFPKTFNTTSELIEKKGNNIGFHKSFHSFHMNLA